MDYLKNLASRESYVLNVGYAPPDGGIGDFCFANNDDGLHLFYIYRKFFEPKDCHAPNQETMLGHAISKDLIHWVECEPALVKRSENWDSAHLWAPSVVKSNGLWYMLYTGMDDSINQKIGVATSDNLYSWQYPVDDPIIDVSGYSWADSNRQSFTNCRDPFIFEYQDMWLCYYTAANKEGLAVMGLAVSHNLIEWEDKGYVISQPLFGGELNGATEMMESPCIFSNNGQFYLVYNQGDGLRYVISSDPYDFHQSSVHKLMDYAYNFEIVDLKTGLFGFATQGYFSSLRFAFREFDKNGLLTLRFR